MKIEYWLLEGSLCSLYYLFNCMWCHHNGGCVCILFLTTTIAPSPPSPFSLRHFALSFAGGCCSIQFQSNQIIWDTRHFTSYARLFISISTVYLRLKFNTILYVILIFILSVFVCLCVLCANDVGTRNSRSIANAIQMQNGTSFEYQSRNSLSLVLSFCPATFCRPVISLFEFIYHVWNRMTFIGTSLY